MYYNPKNKFLRFLITEKGRRSNEEEKKTKTKNRRKLSLAVLVVILPEATLSGITNILLHIFICCRFFVVVEFCNKNKISL